MKKLLITALILAGASITHAQDFTFAHEGTPEQRQRLKDLEGTDTPPALELKDWINSEPLSLEDLKGKVVVLDFWATWCGPCIRSIPKTNEMAEKWGDKVVIIGICHDRGSEKMAAVAKKHEIKYPLAVDIKGATGDAYKNNGFPDYYIIDQNGKLVVADCANGQVEAAVDKLLKD